MAVSDSPAQGGTITSTTGTANDQTNAGGGVQLTDVNATLDLPRVAIGGETTNNASSSPTANGLDIEPASANPLDCSVRSARS